MNGFRIAENVVVSSQIDPADVAEIAAAGFKTIVCNRPDHEDPGQPTADAIEQACDEHGIDFLHLPIKGPHIPLETVERFAALLSEAAGDVFTYCRSGQRSAYLWNLVATRAP